MRKKFFYFLTAVLVFSPFGTFAAFNNSSAESYLLSHSDNPWSIMALAAQGNTSASTTFLKNVSSTTAIGYEAPILAIASINQDPKTFGNTDYVAALKGYYNSSQIGDSTTLNDDYFGVLALIAVGEPFSDQVIVGSKNFISQHQNSDGGWGFTTTSSSDSNDTAAAILALLASGTNSSDIHVQNAINYLQSLQQNDGGFGYDSSSISDSSSTAWVIWALNSLNINPGTWSKGDNNPITYLQSNQDSTGFFKYQAASSEDSFSAATTAYAVIALQGKFLPVHIFPGGSTSAQAFPFRIEGSDQTVCSGNTAGPTALDIVKNASTICGFTYNIQATSFGPYLNQIGSDTASGDIGWMYLVDSISPPVGAASYQLKTGDDVLWFFGDFSWLPTKLTISSGQINSGQATTVTLQDFNNNTWSPVSGAAVYFGASSATTDANGQATISPADGFYKIFAQKTGFIRSNTVSLQVGQPASSSVSLSASLPSSGSVLGTSTPPSTISFTLSASNLDFGQVNPGSSSTKNLTLNNTSTANLHFAGTVTGSPLFVDNLSLNSTFWSNFRADVAAGTNQNISLKLTVPSNFNATTSGQTGQLTFWAMAE